ncbi:MAG TPA: RnfABCDGE type electron transport complex subunit G [Rhodanobacteraceae bacterium]
MNKSVRAERNERSEWGRSAFAAIVAICVCIALLTGAWVWLSPRIAAQREHARLLELADVLPPALYDNDPLTDRIEVRDPLLGSDQPQPILRARLHGEPTALVLQAVAPNGYGGPITLRIGIRYDGSIIAARVLEQHETPGIGDLIEHAKSDWIEQFRSRSLRDPHEDKWKLRKDGGDFDQLAGATVTPRAVVAAVGKALRFYGENRRRLFATTNRP